MFAAVWTALNLPVSCPFCQQAMLQLPAEASGSNMDHRQGAGQCGFLQILEEDPCGGLQVGLLTHSHLHTITFLHVVHTAFSVLIFRSVLVCTDSITLNSRHQRNGAVISRCSQPEISWWGWRNTDDEYLVTSIAKACQMDTGAKGTCGAPACRQRGEAPDSSDSDFGKAVVWFMLMHAP